MNQEILNIGIKKYRKTSNGVFEVSYSELGEVQFCDLPYYSTIEITNLPSNKEPYKLCINATHGGGPENEFFSIFYHVDFWQAEEVNDRETIDKCTRRLRHIRRFFNDLVDSGYVEDDDESESRNRSNGKWWCGILYSSQFDRHDNPILFKEVTPFVEQFKLLIQTPEIYLFLCHASEDKQFVDKLATYLDTRSVDIWYDKREIKVGESIVSRVNDGLSTASHLVVVLSKASVTKIWVQKELSVALMKHLSDRSITILPLLHEDCTIPPLLQDIKWADCRNDQVSGFRQLIDDIINL